MPNTAVRGKVTPVSPCCQLLVTDEAWALIAPLLPVAAATGRPRKRAVRRLLEAVAYLLRTGCQWRALPDAFPPYSTVQRHFYAWRDAGLFERINHLLVMLDREQEGREASPSAAVIDSQSIKTSETGGTKGYDRGKKLVGLKTSSILTGCSPPVCRRRTCTIPALRRTCCAPRAGPGRSWRPYGRIQPIAASGSAPPRRSAWPSSPARQTNAGSSCRSGARSLKGQSPGSGETGGWPKTTSAKHQRRWPSYSLAAAWLPAVRVRAAS